MGNRLSRIYTRTGDTGTTGLGSGERVPKDHARVEAYGTVDELNSTVGAVLAHAQLRPELRDCLVSVQHRLFDLGGELCLPGYQMILSGHVEALERQLDRFNEELAPLKDFVLPGGCPPAAACHIARTVCRRAERRCWSLAAEDSVNEEALKYLNRLSDLLFVIARVLNQDSGSPEPIWEKSRT